MANKLPREWVERIFERLKCTFKEKWTDFYEKHPGRKDLYLEMWSTGLSGLSAKEIQRALLIFELSDLYSPPTVMEFFHCARGHTTPPRKESSSDFGITSQVAKENIRAIQAGLKGVNVPRGT